MSHLALQAMEKIRYLLLPILLLVGLSVEVKSFDTLYSSKEECLQKNINGQDKEMVTSLCSSLVYPPSKKEQTEILRKQKERDKQQQETYDDAVERKRSIKQKELEKDPTYQKQQQEREKLFRCKIQKENLQKQYSRYTSNGKKLTPDNFQITSQQLPSECWGLYGL